jgi:hypothetical protein
MNRTEADLYHISIADTKPPEAFYHVVDGKIVRISDGTEPLFNAFNGKKVNIVENHLWQHAVDCWRRLDQVAELLEKMEPYIAQLIVVEAKLEEAKKLLARVKPCTTDRDFHSVSIDNLVAEIEVFQKKL